MPCTTGLSSCSAVRPILPSPSARSVPRWRCDWPIWLRTCVSRSLAIRAHLLRLGLRRRAVRQHLVDRLAARLRDLFGPPELAQRLLCRLEHVDRVRRAERLREHVADPAELEHGADAAAGDHA